MTNDPKLAHVGGADASGDQVVETIKVVNKFVDGYDAQFWHDSYILLREAVIAHLDDCIRDDDVAEEAILVEAIETAGKRLKQSGAGADAAPCDALRGRNLHVRT